ncbi:MAG: HD domain-containing protein [Desulfobacterales bacterium]|jgi:putative hydrolase of HD superfamily
MTKDERLDRQLAFVLEIDRLKQVRRQTLLTDRSRQENAAEHSWHMAVMAILLAENARQEDLDLLRVLQMLVIHDIVEIDAGDTFCYDDEGRRDQRQREEAAADRIFGLLPEDQGAHIRALWEEFEARETPEARFAAALDRLQPLLHNFTTAGLQWRIHGVTREKVIERNGVMKDGAPDLWRRARALIDEAVEKKHLSR